MSCTDDATYSRKSATWDEPTATWEVVVQGLLVGLDLYGSDWVTKFLRLGAFIGTDFFFLSRERSPLPGSIFPLPPDIQNRALYSETGGSIAYTINLGLRGAFDIGF